MANVIVLLVVAALLGVALRGSIKHLKGDSPCCGGGGGTLDIDMKEKALERPVLGKKVLKISGMHCEHCQKAVMDAINQIEGASAKVNLAQNEAVVSYDREIDEDALKKAVKEAGYRVVEVTA